MTTINFMLNEFAQVFMPLLRLPPLPFAAKSNLHFQPNLPALKPQQHQPQVAVERTKYDDR